jgi:hypothetical protein
MKRRSSRIEFVNCRRCGKPLATLSAVGRRRLHTSEARYQKYGRICSDCITAEEARDNAAGSAADRLAAVRA